MGMFDRLGRLFGRGKPAEGEAPPPPAPPEQPPGPPPGPPEGPGEEPEKQGFLRRLSRRLRREKPEERPPAEEAPPPPAPPEAPEVPSGGPPPAPPREYPSSIFVSVEGDWVISDTLWHGVIEATLTGFAAKAFCKHMERGDEADALRLVIDAWDDNGNFAAFVDLNASSWEEIVTNPPLDSF